MGKVAELAPTARVPGSGRGSTGSSVIVRGAPGCGSSTSPSSRRSTNREPNLPTVGRDTPNSAATSELLAPVAQHSTIRQRNACELFRFLDHSTRVCAEPLGRAGGEAEPQPMGSQPDRCLRVVLAA